MQGLTLKAAKGLYDEEQRVTDRSAALRAAKTEGPSPIDVVIQLARSYGPLRPSVLEVGPGRGSLILRAVDELSPRSTVVVDHSLTMLSCIDRRRGSRSIDTIKMDYHDIGDLNRRFDVVIAAFCLYHSPYPRLACQTLIDRCAADGLLIAATKSDDSYRQLDHLVSATGVDPAALDKPSLYQTFSSQSAQPVVEAAGRLVRRIDHGHRFVFPEPICAARYAVTVPKYSCHGADPAIIAEQFANRWPTDGLVATSTVSYFVARAGF